LAAASPIGRSSPSTRRPTILVVDDEVLLRWMIAEELRAKGFVVIEAANSDEARMILQTSTDVSIVMTDVRMPGSMDGIGLAQWVRAARPDLKIVIASAHPPAGAGHDIADAYFLKPYDIDRLIHRIRELLAVH
jgi:two-component system, response regulator PdtaR